MLLLDNTLLGNYLTGRGAARNLLPVATDEPACRPPFQRFAYHQNEYLPEVAGEFSNLNATAEEVTVATEDQAARRSRWRA
ncbi:MAG: hypothetical protein V5A43_10230 [Haloarculaceae archaeon]